jgi:hypothetical protein
MRKGKPVRATTLALCPKNRTRPPTKSTSSMQARPALWTSVLSESGVAATLRPIYRLDPGEQAQAGCELFGSPPSGELEISRSHQLLVREAGARARKNGLPERRHAPFDSRVEGRSSSKPVHTPRTRSGA